MRYFTFMILPILVVGLGVGAIWSNKGVEKTTVKLSTKDLVTDGLSMFTPSDSEFTSAFAEAGELPAAMAAVKPYSVILRNTGTIPVVAFMLKWDLVTAGGVAMTRQYQYVTAFALQGQGTNHQGGNIIRPNSNWLLAPGMAMELETLAANKQSPGLSAQLNAIARDMANFSTFTVSLDGVFFNDGTFTGPNSTQFFEKMTAFHKARRDLLEDLSMKAKVDKNEHAFRDVEFLSKEPKVKLGKASKVSDYYNRFKADFADDIMKMKSVSGSEKTLDYYLGSLKKPWPTLKKKNQ